MSFDPNDPRWTAYVLGELPEGERAELEKLVESDEAARRLCAELRETVAMLEGELGSEAAEGLTDTQREAVQAGPVAAPAGKLVRAPAWRWGVYGGAAVALAAGVLIAVNLQPTGERQSLPRTTTMDEPKLQKETGLALRTEGPGKPAERAEGAAAGLSAPTPATPPQAAAEPSPARKTWGGGEEYKVAAPPLEAKMELAEKSIAAADPAAPGRPAGKKALSHLDGSGSAPSTATPLGNVASADRGGRRDPMRPPPDAYWRGPEQPAQPELSREGYDAIQDNPFLRATEAPLSTFSIDVDTASYSNVRRMILQEGRRPPRGAVRIEELVNYFSYAYEQPAGDRPFAADVEIATCPWTPAHRLVRIGLRGKTVDTESRPAANLVFLIDVSGSMQPANKLPLLRQGLRLLVNQLRGDDRVAIVVYAGSTGLVLPSTPGHERSTILAALDRLGAGGSTNGGAGIQLAYQVVQDHFIPGGVNRVLLATDGDFNVGISDRSSLVGLIQEKAKSGAFLTVLGFGSGNYQDAQLEDLADKGNGNYAYIDSEAEARKVLVEQVSGTLLTIAKDVKIQIEFNPSRVAGYRLIGYENRVLAAQDFNDDRKDAGEIGAGHTVTALYEVVPVGVAIGGPGVDPLKYQVPPVVAPAPVPSSDSPDLLTVKLRYKLPEGSVSTKAEFPVVDAGQQLHHASRDFRFAASVAAFGMLLRDSPHKGGATWDLVLEMGNESRGADPDGRRAEFLELVRRAQGLGALHPSAEGYPTWPQR